jgi:hypothetical protein
MTDPETPMRPDPRLAAALRALETPVTDADVEALRARVMARAASRLRVAASTSGWWDVTRRVGRVVVPLSIAAAILAMVLVQRLPDAPIVATADNDSMLAFDVDASNSESVLLDLLPENADALLLASPTPAAR